MELSLAQIVSGLLFGLVVGYTTKKGVKLLVSFLLVASIVLIVGDFYSQGREHISDLTQNSVSYFASLVSVFKNKFISLGSSGGVAMIFGILVGYKRG